MKSGKSTPRNKTIRLNVAEQKSLSKQLVYPKSKLTLKGVSDKIICADVFETAKFFPKNFVDLLFLDPPYNHYKTFNKKVFKKMSHKEYAEYLDSFFPLLIPTLKKSASIYVCGDWNSSASIINVLEKYFNVRNRITWEREKGRGAARNWKNNSEDIWFCTVSEDYTFNTSAVKLRRRVMAPYRVNGEPKDWEEQQLGNFRLTYPSNIWTDISVPFWSMPENTEHPTQKPEKLLAKIILASSNEGDMVFDPCAGSGTTAVVAKKLNRKYSAVEIDEKYACLALKRLAMADENNRIQGYEDGVFWERNSQFNRTKTK